VLGHVPDDREGYGRIPVEAIGLSEHGDGRSATTHDPAVVRLESARQQRDERRLAVAVVTDDSDAVARVDPERDRVEDPLRRVLKTNVLASEQIRHSTDLDPHVADVPGQQTPVA
jgi:hypothetical protein